MANTKSANKRLRQNEKKHLKNKSIESTLKTKTKKFIELVNTGKKEEANKLLREIEKILDKATNKNIIHKNKASRQKSRLMKLLSSS